MALMSKSPSLPVRILAADVDGAYLQQLRDLLETSESLELIGEASDRTTLLGMVRELNPDLILFGITKPLEEGIQTLQEIESAEIPVRVILFTDTFDPRLALRSFRLGARGIVLKESTTQHLVAAIGCATAGRYWVVWHCVANLTQALRALPNPFEVATDVSVAELSSRELQIIRLVVAGHSNTEIAEICSISEWAVKRHMSNIFDKLGVSNRIELAFFAVNHRWLDSKD